MIYPIVLTFLLLLSGCQSMPDRRDQKALRHKAQIPVCPALVTFKGFPFTLGPVSKRCGYQRHGRCQRERTRRHCSDRALMKAGKPKPPGQRWHGHR